MIPQYNLQVPTDITLIIVLGHVAAILCTIARLFYRWKRRRLWWEDIWAAVAAVFAVLCMAGLLLYDDDTAITTRRDMISQWLASLAFTIVLWSTRLSIFLSLVRVSNPTGRSRRIALACVIFFILMCLALTGQKIYYCAVHQCHMLLPVAIAQLTTDVISDVILVLAPIPLLRDVRLSKNRRILILSAFSSSILISAVSMAHSILMLRYSINIFTLIFAELKAALALFICNILVMVTFAYRLLSRRGKRQDIDLDASLGHTSPMHFTTIDLNQLTAGTFSGGDATTGTVSRTFNTTIGTGTGTGTQEYTMSQGPSSRGDRSTTEESLETTKMSRSSLHLADSGSDLDKDGELFRGHDVC